MKELTQKGVIDESRVILLLGLPREQLHQICETSGLGRKESGNTSGRLEFTYEELHKLCRLIIGPAS
jgi:hypothetical protein